MVGILGQVVRPFLLGGQARLPVLLDRVPIHLLAIFDNRVLLLAASTTLVLTVVALAEGHHLFAEITRRSIVYPFRHSDLIAEHLTSQFSDCGLIHGEGCLAPQTSRIRQQLAMRHDSGSALVLHVFASLPDEVVFAASYRRGLARYRIADVAFGAVHFVSRGFVFWGDSWVAGVGSMIGSDVLFAADFDTSAGVGSLGGSLRTDRALSQAQLRQVLDQLLVVRQLSRESVGTVDAVLQVAVVLFLLVSVMFAVLQIRHSFGRARNFELVLRGE